MSTFTSNVTSFNYLIMSLALDLFHDVLYLHEFSNLPRIFAEIDAAVGQDSTLVSSLSTSSGSTMFILYIGGREESLHMLMQLRSRPEHERIHSL